MWVIVLALVWITMSNRSDIESLRTQIELMKMKNEGKDDGRDN